MFFLSIIILSIVKNTSEPKEEEENQKVDATIPIVIAVLRHR